MGELKPIGSEKLSGDAKLKRILELTYYQSSNESTKSAEIVKESKTGVYGIVKEKDGYYVKKGLNENSLDYIGGLFMKNKNKFSSYGEAFKKLQFLTEQENLQEATRYVLKQPKPAPQAEAPSPMPTGEAPPEAATPDPTALDTPDANAPAAPGDELGDEPPTDENPDDYLKVIQKMTGRLTQKLNAYQEKLESKDIKYVLNMVLAAVDLDKLDEADEEEILSKFDDEEENPEGMPSDLGTPEGEPEPAPSEDDLGETNGTDGMDALEQLINSPFDDDNTGANEYEFEDDDEIVPAPIDDPDFEDEDEEDPINTDDVVDFSKFDADADVFDDDKGVAHEKLSDTELFDPDKGKDTEKLSKGNQGFSMNEEDPTEDRVKELDIDELTNMVNNSVKDSLSKYFS